MSVYVNDPGNSVSVNPTFNTVNVIQDQNSTIVEVITPGPQGPPGDVNLLTGSFVLTSSFNAFTSSYTTGSFTGSFVGNGSGLTGVISASYSVTSSFAQNFNPDATSSYALQALTASYATNADLLDGKDSSVFATTGSNRFIGNQIITGSLTVSGSSTFTNIGPAVFSGSVTITQEGGITGSLQGTASFAVSASQALTASYASNVPVTSSYAISASQAANANNAISASQAINSKTSSFQTNISFDEGYIPFFDSNNSLSSSTIHQWTTESIAINTTFGTGNNPEALFVFQPNPDSINIITAEANVDNYTQFNLFNRNSGSTASSDIVATADNGNEFVNFIDMGINSSTFTGSIGGPNDAYLYSTGNDLTIGNATANKHVRFFTGGGLVDVYQKLVLNPDDLHEMTGSLDIEGSLNVTDTITGSLLGTASFAVSASQAVTASFAANTLSSSYALNATSASYALTASYAGNVPETASYAISASQAITASYSLDANINTGSFAITGSNIFSGSQGISGSLNVSGGVNVGSYISSSNGGYFAGQIYVSDLTIGHGGNTNNTNTAIGVDALQQNISGFNNTALGFRTLFQNTSGSNNVAVGASNLLLNTSGSFNTAIGSNTLILNTTGSFNTALGNNAGVSASGSGNVFLGNNAGALQTAGDNQLWIANSSTLTPLIKGDFAKGILQLNTPSGSQITGSLVVSNGITGSLEGTASFARNSTSGSYAVTSSYADNFTVAGTLTAQTINVQVITSSIDYVTGSTIFGSQLTNTHQFTGSVTVTGSLAVNNSNVVISNQTGSFATTGSNTFYGDQIISGSSVSALDLRGYNDGIWWFRLFNDTYNLTQSVFAGWVGNDGTAFIGNEVDTPINIYTNANYYNPSLIISSSGVSINKNTSITGSLNVSGRIKSTGSLILQPDQNDVRYLQIYNTAAQDTHITASGGYLFLGDDTTYVKVDNYSTDKTIGIRADNGLTLSGSVYQSGTFYPDAIDWISSSIQQNTGSYILTTNINGLTQYDTYPNIALALQPYVTASFITASNVYGPYGSDSILSASYAQNADLLDGKDSSIFATTGSNIFSASQTIAGNLFLSSSNPLLYNNGTTNAMLFGFFDGGNIYGPYYQIFGNQYANVTQRGSAEFVYDNRNGGGSGFNIASFDGFTWTRKFRTDDNGVQVTGSLQVTNGITGSLFGTASFANNALTSSYSLNINGATNHVPLFNSQNSLVTSAIYQSNSYSIIINQDNNTTAAPEALYVWQPSTSSYNVISGKGNLNNYLQLNIQNLNNGVSASSDVVATANNGNETTNYINMGINGANFSGPLGGANDAYIYSTGVHLHIGNASNEYVGFFAGGDDVDANMKLLLSPSNSHEMTGSLDISGSLTVQEGIIGSLTGTASFANSATTASFALNFNPNATASYAISASHALNANNATTASYILNAVSASYALNATSASYAQNADLLDGKDSSEFATTGSNVFIGTQTITGSILHTGSLIQVGSNTITGSFNISGSTTQIGNNTLLGNTSLSGSVTISGSLGNPTNPNIKIFGDLETNGVIKFLPVSTTIDTTKSGSYIFVSGATDDLYFSQNGGGYSNVTRLRWLEGNLYTGLLNGGVITSQSSTVYQISSGSGIIVNLNASLSSNPYPTVQYLNWPNLSASIAPLTASYQQAFVAIDSTNNIYQQGTPFTDGQFDSVINIGLVLFQNGSTINGFKTQPSVAYGFEQAQNTFNRAFGALKLSGLTLATSGSSTGSLVIGSGTAYSPGSNYTIDPNNPSYAIDPGTNTSKIYRYYQSGSSWVYLTNGGTGYTTIDPGNYSNNGVLTAVPAPGSNWTIQRVFWFPNSVAKAIVVYYGNAYYGTEADAIANINIESFVEAPNTAANAVYIGAIVIKGNGVFTTPADYKIVPGGLFRAVGGSGGGGSVITQTLSGLSDVSISGQTNLQPLVYSTTAGKWINSSNISGSLYGNAQTATTASYALTVVSASYANNSTSASYALTASYASNVPVTASYAISASQAQNANNATTASYALTATSASHAINADSAITSSFALTAATASYVLNAVSASYALNATNASTASYILNAVSSSYALSASQAQNAVSASYAQTATSSSYAATSSYADNFTIKNHFTFDATFNDYATIASTVSGTNNLFTQSTGSFTSAFFKYTVKNSTNARTGEVMAIWNGANVEFTDASTRDLGNTSPVTMSVSLVGSDVQFNAITNTSGWSVKSLATFM